MTEIERLLQQTLTALQNELMASVHTHDQELHQLRREVENLKAQQAALTRQLQRLATSCADFQTLLTRLNALLPPK